MRWNVTNCLEEVQNQCQFSLPKDQPNFDPIISEEVIDGKTVEIVEFNCKLAK